MRQIEKYDVFELRVPWTKSKPEAMVVNLGAVFQMDEHQMRVPAIWNGDEEYIIRFMPDREGIWEYCVTVDGSEQRGNFACVPNTGSNHGRVRAKGQHFQYEDGTRYLPFGTTSYAWIHQPEALQEQTLKTLEASPFNKIRMCVFPKSMTYNNNDPEVYPFEKGADGTWNVHRPVPAFWENLDTRIRELMELGIEADLILFHPYDRWGFAGLSQEDSMVYLEYCMNRLAAYRNIWWSLANEYELLYSKSLQDWEEYGRFLQEKDLYGHLRSVHNILDPYPKTEWLTHCSIQSIVIDRVPVWQQEYDLPILIDECGYEGDLPYIWGNLTGFEMVHRFWWSVCRGAYCTHGETFHREDEVLWWAKGGRLYGESGERIAFMKEVLYSLPGEWQTLPYKGVNPNLDEQEEENVQSENLFQHLLKNVTKETRENFIAYVTPGRIMGEGYFLEYFGHHCPLYYDLMPEEGKAYRVELIDIWEMTRETLKEGILKEGTSESARIMLPAKEGMAVLVQTL